MSQLQHEKVAKIRPRTPDSSLSQYATTSLILLVCTSICCGCMCVCVRVCTSVCVCSLHCCSFSHTLYYLAVLRVPYFILIYSVVHTHFRYGLPRRIHAFPSGWLGSFGSNYRLTAATSPGNSSRCNVPSPHISLAFFTSFGLFTLFCSVARL